MFLKSLNAIADSIIVTKTITPIGFPETVYKTPFVELEETPVRFPNGRTGRYARLNPDTYGGVAVPRIIDDGIEFFGLVRQYRHSIAQFTLEFPRGGTKDESEDEAIRELVEETGLAVNVGRGVRLGKLYADTGILASTVTVWLVPIDTRGDEVFIEEETAASHCWVTEEELRELIRSGELTCGITLAAYSLLQVFNSSSEVQ